MCHLQQIRSSEITSSAWEVKLQSRNFMTTHRQHRHSSSDEMTLNENIDPRAEIESEKNINIHSEVHTRLSMRQMTKPMYVFSHLMMITRNQKHTTHSWFCSRARINFFLSKHFTHVLKKKTSYRSQ